HMSHLPVSEAGRSRTPQGPGFDPGSSTFRYDLSVVRMSVCPGSHDPQVTWHEKTVTGGHNSSSRCPVSPPSRYPAICGLLASKRGVWTIGLYPGQCLGTDSSSSDQSGMGPVLPVHLPSS
ncbi:hypothetical protein BD310DRAFT_834965, partial [Dichomitus squalens]